MNKKIFLLSILIMLVPACRKKSRYAVPPSSPTVSDQSSALEKAQYDEELGAFVVKEDENKFSAAAAAQANQEEELTAASSEQADEDLDADSSKYGIKNLYFEFNKYRINDLRPDQRPVLEHNVNIVKSLANKGYKISIRGHACNSAGSTEYNMHLSHDRAQAVKDYFIEQGVSGEIDAVGFGCEHLLVPTGDERQQAPNRRVEIKVYPPAEKA